MIEIEVSCRTCREIFVPDHSDYVRGLWRTCQRCRDGPDVETAPPQPTDPRPDTPTTGTDRTPS